MKTDLWGTYQLSSPAEHASKTIEGLIPNLNQSISKFEAKIKEWKLNKNLLSLHLVSTGLRAHEALLRLRKPISEALGKEYHLGIRNTRVDDYTLIFWVEKEPLKSISIPFADLQINEKEVQMRLKQLSQEFLEKNYIDRMIKLVKEKVAKQYYKGKKEYWELIWQSKPKQAKWDKDPTEEMLKLGWLKQGPTKGKWFFYPPAASILSAMEEIAIKEVLAPLGFKEVIEPHHVPLEVWLKTEHLKSIPGEIYYVSEPLTRKEAEWEDFTDLVKITHKVPEELLKQHLASPKSGICYAQCPIIYWSLQNKTVAEESLPIKVFERRAISNRYESGGRHGIERVDEFHRIEPVYIGTKSQLLDLKEELIERYRHVFEDLFELEWRMAWVTPFYLAQAGELYEAKEEHVEGTIDFEAWMPYRGNREKSEWLEYQNLSIVGERYIKAFNIKGQRSELWSGCSGIGLERWTASFLAQKSLDPANWPEQFKNYLEELPKGIKFL
jgi:seryl-tRNA synthetase